MDAELEEERSRHIGEQLRKFKPNSELYGKTLLERYKCLDPEFKEKVENQEKHYLEEANRILTEVINEIRARVKDPSTTMNDLIKAFDVIDSKFRISKGMPTAIDASFKMNVIKNMPDEELDKRIGELEQHFLSSPSAPESPLPDSESDPTPSLLSCGTSQELPSTRRRRGAEQSKKLYEIE